MNLYPQPLMTKGEGFKLFFWVREKEDDTLNYGWYGYSKVDSIGYSENSSRYHISFGLPKYKWWLSIFSRGYFKSSLTVLDNKPDSVDYFCSNFKNAKWLKSFQRLDSSGTVRFIFPILPLERKYATYDYFAVIINDSTVIQYQWINDGTVAIGNLINNRHNGDGKTRIYSKSAIVVKLSDKNPLRIEGIQVDTTHMDLIRAYLGYDFKYLIGDSRWFGLSIIDNGIFLLDRPKTISFF